jgi:hypothetical protein
MVGAASWRVVTCAGLLVASGAITIAASAQRWWPACKLGAFDHGDCLVLQDDAFDVVAYSVPWTPVGASVELYGVGLVLLAAAVGLLPRVLGGSAGRLLAAAGWIIALGMLTTGVLVLLSGLWGTVVHVPGELVAGVLGFFGLPLLIVTSLAKDLDGPLPGIGWRMTAAAALLLNNPLATYLLAGAIFSYLSYDTTPWTEAVGGATLVVAGVALLPTLRTPAGAPQPSTPVGETPAVPSESA